MTTDKKILLAVAAGTTLVVALAAIGAIAYVENH